MLKMLFTTNIPAPYTADFFDSLSQYINLTVIFERRTAKNREDTWLGKESNKYKSVFLKGINVGEEAAFCPGIIDFLKRPFDVIIIGDYSSPTGILAINYLNFHHIKYAIHIDGGIVGAKSGLRYDIKKHLMKGASSYFSPGEVSDKYLRVYGNANIPIYHYPFTSIREKDVLHSLVSKKEKERIREELGMTKKCDICAVSVGSIIHRKGYDILINALGYVSANIDVYIVGGNATQELTNQMKMNNVQNVHFIHFKDHDVALKYMKCADLFILPTRYDIWGLVINEALAMGLPVITTDMCVAGLELVKNGKNGFIVPAENIELLGKAIDEYDGLSEEQKTCFSNESLKRAQQYTIEKMAKKYACNVNEFATQLKQRSSDE
jgi:glycosyltransferase involved in cell wall biosynthesis